MPTHRVEFRGSATVCGASGDEDAVDIVERRLRHGIGLPAAPTVTQAPDATVTLDYVVLPAVQTIDGGTP